MPWPKRLIRITSGWGFPQGSSRRTNRLLGVRRFEANAEVISNAADQRVRHLRSIDWQKAGGNAEAAQRNFRRYGDAARPRQAKGIRREAEGEGSGCTTNCKAGTRRGCASSCGRHALRPLPPKSILEARWTGSGPFAHNCRLASSRNRIAAGTSQKLADYFDRHWRSSMCCTCRRAHWNGRTHNRQTHRHRHARDCGKTRENPSRRKAPLDLISS